VREGVCVQLGRERGQVGAEGLLVSNRLKCSSNLCVHLCGGGGVFHLSRF